MYEDFNSTYQLKEYHYEKSKNNRIKKDYKRGLAHRIRSRGIDQMSDVEIRIVFLPIMQSRIFFAMKRGKLFISMYLLWLMVFQKETFYFGDWIKKPGVAIFSCNDS